MHSKFNILTNIQTFLLIWEQGSFSAAAHSLRLSVTAVSKQIRVLEQHWGGPLFLRTTRSVSLTPLGEVVYERAKELASSLNDLETVASGFQQVPRGRVRVLVSPSFGGPLVLAKLKDFQDKYPQVSLDLEYGEREHVNLQKEGLQVLIGFTHTPGLTEPMRFKAIAQVRHCLVASPKLFETYEMPKDREDLQFLPFINHILRVPPNQILLSDGTIVKTSRPKLTMNSFRDLHEASLAGLGAFLSPDLLVKEDVAEGRLIALFPDLPYRSFELFVFYKHEDLKQPAVRAVVECFGEI